MNQQQGKPIRFVKGTYAGLTGWIDNRKKPKEGSTNTPVIVQLGEDTFKATRVKRASFRNPFTPPATKEMAAIQQHPDIELATIKLAEMWAEIGDIDKKAAAQLLTTEIEFAMKLQNKLKGKARYRSVEWPYFKRGRDNGYDAMDTATGAI
jgi:hypothetical protein